MVRQSMSHHHCLVLIIATAADTTIHRFYPALVLLPVKNQA
jgi:hypothetical protein